MSGLPLALEALIGSLLDTMQIKSWSIFNEQNGACCLKVRWIPPNHDSVPASANTQKAPVVKYKKKSPAAVTRDTKRSMDYHQDRVQTRSKSRITLDSDKEQARSLDTEDIQATVQSPILVESVTPASSMDSPIISVEGGASELVKCDLFQGEIPVSGSENNLTCKDSVKDSEQLIASSNMPSDINSEIVPPCQVCQCYSHPTIRHSIYNPDMKMYTCSDCDVFVCDGCITRVACKSHLDKVTELPT